MYNNTKAQVWYGELRTARGNTVLIHDKQFPEASAGRVYFYNTQRDAIIEYAEDIVKGNLHDLDESAQLKAQAEFGQAWHVTREAFMEKHEAWVEATNPKSKPAPKKAKTEALPEIDNIDSDDAPSLEDDADSGFGDSWANESYNDEI